MPASSQRLKMRDLERRTGVGREAIRFYIRAGLLPEPERPARNVAWYDESFIERILLIKKLQQERFLPLAIIRGIVGGQETLTNEEARTIAELDGVLLPGDIAARSRPPERLDQIAKRLGMPRGDILKLADAGAFRVRIHGGKHCLEGNAITIVELWARVRRAGFDEKLGFGPERIALYVQFAEWLALEEAKLFARNVTGKIDRETSRHMAEEAIAGVNQLLGLLREEALQRIIAEGIPGSREETKDAVGE